MAAFDSDAPDSSGLPAEIDTSRPHPARMYDYFLGGKDNITQVVSGNPYTGRTVPIQARYGGYSKIGPFAVA
jgi:hypothetical protein